jgi:hypothetical protein
VPDLSDDIADIPGLSPAVGADGNPDEKESKMAATIDALVEKLVDQNYTKTFARLDAYAEQFVSQATFVNTSSMQMYSMAVQIVNSTALARIPTSTPNQVLEHNATQAQPWAATRAPAHTA